MKDTWGRENRTLADRVCEFCGVPFRPKARTRQFCSHSCANSRKHRVKRTLPRKAGPIWWPSKKGYVNGYVWVEGKRKSIIQHRWIMEQHLGRALRPDEDVHHRNGIKNDNRIENLQVIAHDEHARLTCFGRIYRRGYTLNLTAEQRAERSERMRRMRAAQKEQ